MTEVVPPHFAPHLESDLLQQIVEAQSALAALNFDLEEFMKDVVSRMQRLTGATGAVVELLEGEEMVYRAASGSVAPYVGMRLQAQHSLSGLCVRDAKILISEDTADDPRVDAAACKRVGAASMVVVPLLRRGTTVGVLKVLSTMTHAFQARDVEILRLMAGLLGAMLGQQLEVQNRGQTEDQLRYQVHHDDLTGLPNRTLFYDRLVRALGRQQRNKSLLALIYLDLDRFKPINDTHGHDKGDRLLRLFATRIGAILRQVDTFARLGGDEFTIILEDAGSVANVERIVAKIIEAAHREFDVGDLVVKIGVSAGMAFAGDGTVDPEVLIQRADRALYEAKRAGRGAYRIAER